MSDYQALLACFTIICVGKFLADAYRERPKQPQVVIYMENVQRGEKNNVRVD